MTVRKSALLIGINHYPNIAGGDLDGCLADVELMHSVLTGPFGFEDENVETLTDGEATRAGILRALASLEKNAAEDDIVVFFYAGHGSRMADPRKPGRMIESIVSHDSGRGEHPNRDLIDEEIDQWVQRVNRKTPYVTLIMDCCHSGSVSRDPFGDATREVAPDLRPPEAMFRNAAMPDVLSRRRETEPGEDEASGWFPGRRSVVVLAACRAEEYANEHRYFDGKKVRRHGAMSYFLGETLLDTASGSTWRDVFERLSPKIRTAYERQHPQLEGKVHELLFATEQIRPTAYLQVSTANGPAVELAGGAAHGVTPGSRWSIRSFGARNRHDGRKIATGVVETVRAAACGARLADAKETVEPGQRAFLDERRLPEPGLRWRISTSDEMTEERRRLERLLGQYQLLAPAATLEEADVLIRCLPPRSTVTDGDACPGLGPLATWTWAAVGRDGRIAVRLRAEQPPAPADLDGLARDLVRLARYRRLLILDNPDPTSRLRGKVEMRVLHGKSSPDGVTSFVDVQAGGDGRLIFAEGDGTDVVIHNRHDHPVWITLVQFGVDGAIQLFLPYVRHSTFREEPGKKAVRFEPGESRSVRDYFLGDTRLAPVVQAGLPLRLPRGFPWIAEAGERHDVGVMYLKLLVTPVDADFEFLEQESVRFEITHRLQELAFLYHSGKGKRSMIPAAIDESPESDWATSTVAVGIRRG